MEIGNQISQNNQNQNLQQQDEQQIMDNNQIQQNQVIQQTDQKKKKYEQKNFNYPNFELFVKENIEIQPDFIADVKNKLKNLKKIQCPACQELKSKLYIQIQENLKENLVKCGDCWFSDGKQLKPQEEHFELVHYLNNLVDQCQDINVEQINQFNKNFKDRMKYNQEKKKTEIGCIFDKLINQTEQLKIQLDDLIMHLRTNKQELNDLKHKDFYKFKTYQFVSQLAQDQNKQIDKDVSQILNFLLEDLKGFKIKEVQEFDNNYYMKVLTSQKYSQEYEEKIRDIEQIITQMLEIKIMPPDRNSFVGFKFEPQTCKSKLCPLVQKNNEHECKIKINDQLENYLIQGELNADKNEACNRQIVKSEVLFSKEKDSKSQLQIFQHQIKFKILKKGRGSFSCGIQDNEKDIRISHFIQIEDTQYCDNYVENMQLWIQNLFPDNQKDEFFGEIKENDVFYISLDFENNQTSFLIHREGEEMIRHAKVESLQDEEVADKIQKRQWQFYFLFDNCDTQIQIISCN